MKKIFCIVVFSLLMLTLSSCVMGAGSSYWAHPFEYNSIEDFELATQDAYSNVPEYHRYYIPLVDEDEEIKFVAIIFSAWVRITGRQIPEKLIFDTSREHGVIDKEYKGTPMELYVIYEYLGQEYTIATPNFFEDNRNFEEFSAGLEISVVGHSDHPTFSTVVARYEGALIFSSYTYCLTEEEAIKFAEKFGSNYKEVKFETKAK